MISEAFINARSANDWKSIFVDRAIEGKFVALQGHLSITYFTNNYLPILD